MTPSVRAAIEAAVRADRRVVPRGATLIAVGWSTVDFDRAAAQLGVDVAPLPDDVALGASCRGGTEPDGRAGPVEPALILLEPSTEGRLAAALARHGEGPIASWWDADLDDTDLDAGTAFEGALLPEADGPLGPARLMRDGARDGRFRFLRARRAATISA